MTRELAPVKRASKPKPAKAVARIPNLEAAYGKLEALCTEVTASEDQDGSLNAALVRRFQDAKLDTMDAIDGRIEELLAIDTMLPAARAMRDGWQAKVNFLKSAEAFLKARTHELLTTHPDLPRAGTIGRLAVEKNGGALPLDLTFGDRTVTREIIEMFEIDPRFYRVTITLDTDAIRAALGNGDDLPWARLGERGTHVKPRA